MKLKSKTEGETGIALEGRDFSWGTPREEIYCFHIKSVTLQIFRKQ